jgi:hypothetical protein
LFFLGYEVIIDKKHVNFDLGICFMFIEAQLILRLGKKERDPSFRLVKRKGPQRVLRALVF